MHPIAAKIIGRPAIRNLDIELETIDRKVAKLRQAQEPAQNYAAIIDDAAKAFSDAPTPALCRAWITAEAGRQGAAAVAQRTRDLVIGFRTELLNGIREQIRAAMTEVISGLKEQQAKVNADDAARSTELGELVRSDAVLAVLDKKISQIEDARAWVDQDPDRTVSAIKTVLG